MSYVAGIDGGGTKTRCIIGDLKGNIVGDYTNGASNHQVNGKDTTIKVLKEVYIKALKMAGLDSSDIKHVFLGLSGADLPSDFDILNEICHEIFENTPFNIVNDAWISMRSGLKGTWGAVSICGTGSNAGACHMDGRKVILSALSYELGNYGGGSHITQKALHYAFRAYEGTGMDTMLVTELPAVLGALSMEELLTRLYPQRKIKKEKLQLVAPLVFQLANKRDRVCQDILISMGHVMGEMTAGVIKRLNMEDLKVPVVLGGSIYKGDNPLMIDELTTVLHREVPKAYIIIPELPPVAGAYLSALDSVGIVPDKNTYDNLKSKLG